MINVTPVILSGGSGTRLWPLSRAMFPKQFLCLAGDSTLFQDAVHRLSQIEGDGVVVAPPLVVTGEEHRFLVMEQMREIGIDLGGVLLEPVGRNTAPALTLAALAALECGDDPVLAVTPSDQLISNPDAYTAAMRKAVKQAGQGHIVILGVKPSRPETGYGYIQVDSDSMSINKGQPVKRFVEKPNASTAQSYLDVGGYFWNAGVFVLRASLWIKVLEQFRPDILQSVRTAWDNRTKDQLFVRPGRYEFSQIPSESVDYAAIEKCPGSNFSIQMVSLDAGWSDLGSWSAVWDTLPKDVNDNVLTGDVLVSDSRSSLVYASSRLVSLVGVSDLVVVETADAVLVADKSSSQDVKLIAQALGCKNREEQTLHRKVHRPWGWYDTLDEGERFKVKRILVRPRASLSLQRHQHRAEHWIVVKGTAEITIGDRLLRLEENQSSYIPVGEVHRLSNPGVIPLEIIEIQSGFYVGEDDIVRLNDDYGRVSD